MALRVTSSRLTSLTALLTAWLTDLQQALLIGGRLSHDLSNQLAMLLDESGRTMVKQLADNQYAGVSERMHVVGGRNVKSGIFSLVLLAPKIFYP